MEVQAVKEKLQNHLIIMLKLCGIEVARIVISGAGKLVDMICEYIYRLRLDESFVACALQTLKMVVCCIIYQTFCFDYFIIPCIGNELPNDINVLKVLYLWSTNDFITVVLARYILLLS